MPPLKASVSDAVKIFQATLPDNVAAFMQSVPAAVYIPTVVLALVTLLAWMDKKRATQRPRLSYQPSAFNEGILSRMPTIRRLYKPLLFLTNGHIETIWAAKTRSTAGVTYRRETMHCPDGGIVSLDWRVPHKEDVALADTAPVVILLPGLTGGSDDTYVRYAASYAEAHGMRAVVFNPRGCGDTPLTTPQFYSGMYIGDMKRVVALVRRRYPGALIFASGWSLGANILVNYLGAEGHASPVAAAVAMCNPFDLALGSSNFARPVNKVYDLNLAASMSRIMQRNRKVWNGVSADYDVATACAAPSVRAWDDAITRVTFGFPTVDAYYTAASSARRVPGVRVPLLVVQAADDPIAPIAATPEEALLANPNCILAVTRTGGHLGWISEAGGYFGEPWTDKVIVEFLLSVQVELSRQAVAAQARGSPQQPRSDRCLAPPLDGGAAVGPPTDAPSQVPHEIGWEPVFDRTGHRKARRDSDGLDTAESPDEPAPVVDTVPASLRDPSRGPRVNGAAGSHRDAHLARDGHRVDPGVQAQSTTAANGSNAPLGGPAEQGPRSPHSAGVSPVLLYADEPEGHRRAPHAGAPISTTAGGCAGGASETVLEVKPGAAPRGEGPAAAGASAAVPACDTARLDAALVHGERLHASSRATSDGGSTPTVLALKSAGTRASPSTPLLDDDSAAETGQTGGAARDTRAAAAVRDAHREQTQREEAEEREEVERAMSALFRRLRPEPSSARSTPEGQQPAPSASPAKAWWG